MQIIHLLPSNNVSPTATLQHHSSSDADIVKIQNFSMILFAFNLQQRGNTYIFIFFLNISLQDFFSETYWLRIHEYPIHWQVVHVTLSKCPAMPICQFKAETEYFSFELQ